MSGAPAVAGTTIRAGGSSDRLVVIFDEKGGDRANARGKGERKERRRVLLEIFMRKGIKKRKNKGVAGNFYGSLK